MGQENEANDLLKELEEQNGGPITYRTYCLLHGFGDGTPLNLGGLLFAANGKLIFEDFEKPPGMFDFISRKKKSAYQKFKTYRLISDITGMRYVSAAAVKGKLNRQVSIEGLPDVSPAKRILFQTFIEISFSDSYSWYVEVLQDKELFAIIEE